MTLHSLIRPVAACLSAVLLAVLLGACAPPEKVELHEFAVTITTSLTPLTSYSGSCGYQLDGETQVLSLDGQGNITHNFQAERLMHLNLQKTTRDGLLAMQVRRDGKLIYESVPGDSRERLIFEPLTE